MIGQLLRPLRHLGLVLRRLPLCIGGLPLGVEGVEKAEEEAGKLKGDLCWLDRARDDGWMHARDNRSLNLKKAPAASLLTRSRTSYTVVLPASSVRVRRPTKPSAASSCRRLTRLILAVLRRMASVVMAAVRFTAELPRMI